MILKCLGLCLCLVATYAVYLDIKEKTPENNPDLNRQDLGALQDAWEPIKNAAEEYYYLVYGSWNSWEYDRVGCKRIKTRNLNDTSKTGYYTIDTLQSKKVKTRDGYVEALTQDDYTLENVIRYWYNGACPPGASMHGSYHLLNYDGNYCQAGLQNRWWEDRENRSENYVAISQPSCYVLRNGHHDVGMCELWLSESTLNKTLPHLQNKEPQKKYNDDGPVRATVITQMVSKGDLFEYLPTSCRLAFLLNCGYPTFLTYKKEICDELNEKIRAA